MYKLVAKMCKYRIRELLAFLILDLLKEMLRYSSLRGGPPMPMTRPTIPHGSSIPDSRAPGGGHLPPGGLPPSMLAARPEDLKNYHPSSLPGRFYFISCYL